MWLIVNVIVSMVRLKVSVMLVKLMLRFGKVVVSMVFLYLLSIS